MVDAESQYKKDENLKKEDIVKLQEWLKMQPHLPEISELQLIIFLYSCFYSNEATKKCIDNHYTARTHSPEFFENQNPTTADFQRNMSYCCITSLPKSGPNGELIMYTKIIDTKYENYNFNFHVKLFHMGCNLWSRDNGCTSGLIVILDMKDGTFAHLSKVSLNSVKKMLYYMQEATPLRIKELHFVNPVSFMDKIMNIVRPFMNQELSKLLHIHTNHESLLKYLPADCIPKEIGGTEFSVSEVHASMIKNLTANADYFIAEEKLKSDESKRIGKAKNAGEIFGVEGTFKKLDID